MRVKKMIMTGENAITCRFEALGTINEIKVFGPCERSLLEGAVNRIVQINDRMSAFQPESDIWVLNQNAGLKPTAVHPETLRLLKEAKAFSKLSDGAFDITVRPLIELWGIGKKPNFIPSRREISDTMRRINYKDLMLNEKHTTAYLKRKGQAADLGGIAKGYAADEAKRILTQGGVTSAVIDLGGNIVTIGLRPDGMPWRIGIQNPMAATGEYLGMVTSTDNTIVTSGTNERFFMKDGIRYHHILNPRTGKPAQSALLSVTAVCKNSMEADALTTALFVLGIERGIKLLKRFNAEAVFVTEDYKVYTTEGVKDFFELIPQIRRKTQ